MASRREHVLAVLVYAYPAVVFTYYFLASLYALSRIQDRPRKSKAPKASRRHIGIVVLASCLTATYVVEALTLVINGFVHGPWPSDGLVVGPLFCVVVFAIQLAQLLGNPRPVWYRFRGAWILGLLAELTRVSLTFFTTHQVLEHLPFVTQIVLGGTRILLFAALIFGSIQTHALFHTKSSDEEHQPLLHSTSISTTNGQAGYGSNTKSATSADSESDSDSETDSENRLFAHEVSWERRHQGLKDRLKESGSWINYAKGYRILLPYVWPSRNFSLQLRAAGVLGCLLVSNVLNVLVPRQTAIVIDSLGFDGSTNPWIAVAVFIFLKTLSSEMGVSLLQEWLIIPLQYYSKEQMTCAIYTHIMHLSADFHDSKTSSDLHSAIYGSAAFFDILENLIIYAAPMVVDLVVAVAYLSTIFGPYEGLITVSTGVAFLMLTSRLVDSSRQATKTRRSAMYQELFLRSTGFSGWHTIAAFNQLGFDSNRHADAVATRYIADKKFNLDWQLSVAVQSTALTFGFVASAFLAVSRIKSGHASSGQFAMLLMYWSQLTGPLQFITRISKRLSDNFITAEHTLSIMRTEPSVKNKASARPLKLEKGEIEFDRVEFSYDGKKQVLRDVRLSVPGGQTVAFVGATGAGKSTTLKLLRRYWRSNSHRCLRDRVGVVPQDPILFDDTIMNNVRYGNITATDEEVFEACRAACIHDKIEGFTDGYKTRVGERGIKLSGGELQRVAIARAILKQPDIVLLDEATSAIDTETEYSIQQSLGKLCKGRTTLVVAHRLSTVMNADRIIVVDEGQVLEEGDHDTLIAQGGKYASLWAKQIFLKPKDATKSPQNSSPEHDHSPNESGATKTLPEGSDIRKLNPGAPEFMPSPIRETARRDGKRSIIPHCRDSEESQALSSPSGDWSDDVEPHESRIEHLKRSRLLQSSDPSSEDSGRRASADQSATTVSTASGYPSVQDMSLSDLSNQINCAAHDKAGPSGKLLSQSSEITYKRPHYSRRGQSKSEPPGTCPESGLEEAADGSIKTIREGSTLEEGTNISQIGECPQGLRHVSAPALKMNSLCIADTDSGQQRAAQINKLTSRHPLLHEVVVEEGAIGLVVEGVAEAIVVAMYSK
ncbi:ABC transporter domain-containing protein [Sarocladium implicatum]|nr:ABC transporter domain-containing protein [Sarocladium implicatum]